MINPDGFEIPFHPEDIKALLALLYFSNHSRNLGERCNLKNPPRDDQGRVISYACRDVNPGALFIALFNRLGRKNSPFVIERDNKKAVWNYPVVGYHIKLENIPEASSTVNFKENYPTPEQIEGYLAAEYIYVDGDPREKQKQERQVQSYREVYHHIFDHNPTIYQHAARETSYLLKVTMEVTLQDNEPDKFIHESYPAIIELDSALNIIGGEWLKNFPDFIWFPGPPLVDKNEFLKENPFVFRKTIKHLLQLSQQNEKPLPEAILKQPSLKASVHFWEKDQNNHRKLNLPPEIRLFYHHLSPDRVMQTVGKVKSPKMRFPIKAQYVSQDENKSWNFEMDGPYFYDEERWYKWNSDYAFSFTTPEGVNIQSPPLRLPDLLSDPTFWYKSPLYINQSYNISKSAQVIQALLELKQVHFPTLLKPSYVRVLEERRDQENRTTLHLGEEKYNLKRIPGNRMFFTLHQKVHLDTKTIYFIFFQNASQTDQQDQELQAVTDLKVNNQIRVKIKKAHEDFWQDPQIRKNYPLQLSLENR